MISAVIALAVGLVAAGWRPKRTPIKFAPILSRSGESWISS
jgi:hypothetical protein